MESLSLEEKIASFKKKIDDLDQSAAPPPVVGSKDESEATSLYEAPELGNGKIAAMKQRLVRKGLSVSGGGGAADGGESSPAAVPNGGGGGIGTESDEDGGGGCGSGPTEAEKAAKLAAEFEKGKIAAMKNRLVAKGLGIDDSASEAPAAGPAAAARAAHAAAKATAAAAYAATLAAASPSPPPPPAPAEADDVPVKTEGAGDETPATEESKTPDAFDGGAEEEESAEEGEGAEEEEEEEEDTLAAAGSPSAPATANGGAPVVTETDGVAGVPDSAEPTGEPDPEPVVVADDYEKAGVVAPFSAVGVAPEAGAAAVEDEPAPVPIAVMTAPGDEPAPVVVAPFSAVGVAPKAGDTTIEAEPSPVPIAAVTAPGDEPAPVPIADVTAPGDEENDRGTAAANEDEKPSSPTVTPSEGGDNEESSLPTPPSSSTAIPPAPDSQQQQEVLPPPPPPAAPAPAPVAAAATPADVRKVTARTTASEPSPKIEGFNVAASRAKTALAAAKSRSRSSSSSQQASAPAAAVASPAGDAPKQRQRQRQRQPGKRASTPGRQKRASSVGRSASPVRKPSPSVPARPRRQPAASQQPPRSVTSTPVRVSPATGQVSRANLTVAVTPGLHAATPPPPPPPPPAPAPAVVETSPRPRRPTSSPTRRERGASPARSATPARAAVVLTPALAEASGNRLHEQAREARERLERRRTVGGGAGAASPPFVMSSPLLYTPTRGVAVTLSPASAEASGNRLHEQAREARERLERRRKEVAVVTPLVPMPGITSFSPRRWSAPRGPVGGASAAPVVSGLDRLEGLYRDAIERNSKLELARRAEEEKPRECTFTPEISKRGRSLVRGYSGDSGGGGGGAAGGGEAGEGGDGGKGGDGGGGGGSLFDTFDALYQDAKRRQAKMEALQGAHEEVGTRTSPVITAMGRQATGVPIDVRMKEDAERWVRRFQELEEKKAEKEKEGCTFMPNFSIGRSSSAPRMRPRRSNSGGGGGGGGGGSGGGIEAFVARSAIFLEARERNMKKLKQEAEERERALATFKPSILPWGGASAADDASSAADVFERLLRAAENQEMNKAALKEEFLKKEREQYNDFEKDAPMEPLDARIRRSTEEWVKNKALREQRRLELEAEHCTFRPSLGGGGIGAAGTGDGSGGGGGGGGRRGSSVGPRPRARSSTRQRASRRASGGVGPAAATMFAGREAAFQDAKKRRLKALRKEKEQLDFQEATFQPVIGAEARRAGHRGGGPVGGSSRSTDAVAGSVTEAPETKVITPVTVERQSSVELKSQGSAPARSRESSDIALTDGQQQRHQQQQEMAQGVTAAVASPLLQEGAADDGVDTIATAAVAEALAGRGGGAVDDHLDKSGVDQGVDIGELSSRLQQLATASSFDGRDDQADAGDDSDAPQAAADAAPVSNAALQLEEEEEEEEEEANEAGVMETGEEPAEADAEPESEPDELDLGTEEEEPYGAPREAVPKSPGDVGAVMPVNSEGAGEEAEERKGTVESAGDTGAKKKFVAVLSSGADDSAAEEGFDDDSLDDIKRVTGSGGGKGSEGGQAEPLSAKVSAASPARYGSTEGDAGKPPTVGAPALAAAAAGSPTEAEREEEQEQEREREREEEHEREQEEEGQETHEEQEQEKELSTEGEEGDDATSEDASEDFEDDDHDDEEDRYGYTNGASYGSPEASSQTSRSLEDFDRAQREIEEKMKNLGL